MFVIPMLADVAYIFNLELDNETYILRVIWNDMFEFYTLAIENLEREVLVSGIKLVLNTEMIFKYVDPALPPGAIVAVDTNSDNQRLGFNSFRETAKLVYVPQDEVDSL